MSNPLVNCVTRYDKEMEAFNAAKAASSKKKKKV